METVIVLLFVGYGLGLLVAFPVYVWKYVRHSRMAEEAGAEYKPSFQNFVLFLWVVLGFWLWVIFGMPSLLKVNKKTYGFVAKTQLGGIYTCQEAYFAERDMYAGGPDAFDLLAWGPNVSGPHDIYDYYAGEDMIEHRAERSVRFRPDGEWPFGARPGSSDTGFTAMAVGNIDDDDCPDVWMINDAKTGAHIVQDLDDLADPEYCPGCPWPEELSASERTLKRLGFVTFLPMFLALMFVSSFPILPILLIRLRKDRAKYKALKEGV